MSKSHTNPDARLHLTDSDEEIKRKIRLALTDSLPGISYDPGIRPGVSNLLEILGHFEEGVRSPSEIAHDLDGGSMKDLKEQVATKIIDHFSTYRRKYVRLMNEDETTDELHKLAMRGADQAKEHASPTMARVHGAIGLG